MLFLALAPPTLETSGIFLDSTLPQLQKSDRKWEWGANLAQCPISTWWYQHDMWNQLTETDCLIFLRLQGPLVKWRCLSLSFWCLKCWNASYDNGRRPSPLALPLSSTVCSTKTLITLYPATASKCYAKVFFHNTTKFGSPVLPPWRLTALTLNLDYPLDIEYALAWDYPLNPQLTLSMTSQAVGL